MLDYLHSPFFLRPLIAGVLIGIVAGFYGVFVVQRGLSFLGDGLAHAAFGGVALGVLLNAEPLWVALPFTVFVALAINYVQKRTRLAGDTTIGIFFAVSIALGVIFLSMKKGYANDAMVYLFGSILAVRWSDVAMTGGVFAVAMLTWPLWNRWAYATFDRELALADRVPVERDDYILSASIAVAVVASVKLVGMVLIAAFLVIPAATARLLSRTFFSMTLLSAAIGAVSAAVGLWISFGLDKPTGPVIILVQAALFFAVLFVQR